MKADDKIADAAKGFDRIKSAVPTVATVSKAEIGRRDMEWHDFKKAK